MTTSTKNWIKYGVAAAFVLALVVTSIVFLSVASVSGKIALAYGVGTFVLGAASGYLFKSGKGAAALEEAKTQIADLTSQISKKKSTKKASTTEE